MAAPFHAQIPGTRRDSARTRSAPSGPALRALPPGLPAHHAADFRLGRFERADHGSLLLRRRPLPRLPHLDADRLPVLSSAHRRGSVSREPHERAAGRARGVPALPGLPRYLWQPRGGIRRGAGIRLQRHLLGYDHGGGCLHVARVPGRGDGVGRLAVEVSASRERAGGKPLPNRPGARKGAPLRTARRPQECPPYRQMAVSAGLASRDQPGQPRVDPVDGAGVDVPGVGGAGRALLRPSPRGPLSRLPGARPLRLRAAPDPGGRQPAPLSQ